MIFVVVFVFALYSLGANARGRQAWAAVVLIPFAITAFVTDDGDPFHWGDIVFGALIIGGPWGPGWRSGSAGDRERSLTLRTVELERDQDERARAAVAEERARIARELHDVVAHAISVVVVQARGGRKVLASDPEASRTAFDSIERTGEQALGEMRRLLGMLRDDDEEQSRAPQPSLERRRGAWPTRCGRRGCRSSSTSRASRTASRRASTSRGYRIVQEALTNVLKHAGPAIAQVDVHYAADAVEIDGRRRRPRRPHRRRDRQRLLGIRERVAVVGGEIEAGPRRDGWLRRPCSAAVRDDA